MLGRGDQRLLILAGDRRIDDQRAAMAVGRYD
jgi:hypothetical protein